MPHYLVFDEQTGINEAALLDRITDLISKGIGFITIHASPTIDLFRFSTELRTTPITSRGGSIVIRDMLRNNRQRSIYYELFDPIAKLAAQSGIVINLGTAFRSANVADGMDMVTVHELRIQKELIERARSFGAKVILEGPGHLLLSQVDEYVEQTDQMRVPRMPLGPIVTDTFPGLDHITSAIGASYMMSRSKGGIINSVTRVEHQGGIPNAGALIQALDAAHVAAHAATISYHPESRRLDRSFSDSRALIESCVLPRDRSAILTRSKESAGCTRCGHLCPLTSDVYSA